MPKGDVLIIVIVIDGIIIILIDMLSQMYLSLNEYVIAFMVMSLLCYGYVFISRE